jgi:hypothetical protein
MVLFAARIDAAEGTLSLPNAEASDAGVPNAPNPEGSDAGVAFAGFPEATFRMRRARCATAICWGDGYKYGLEPLVELPIGKSFASNGLGGLANFENSHDLSATFTAGLRFWFLHDWASVSVYLSKPLFAQNGSIRVNGSPFEYGAQNIRRPYPGFSIGLFADTVWLGFDIDELRNGDSDSTRDPNFPRNAVVSRALVFTVALSPVTLARNALGNLSEVPKQSTATK